jgi:flagellar basal-body rod protein FlgC
MTVENIGAIVQFGLDYERSRVEVAARNIAIANVPVAPGAGVPVQRVGVSRFAAALPQVELQTATDAGFREVHDPSHPLANAHGMVSYPRIDPALEMATLVAATRAYEADVRAYNTLRAMTLKAFEIGKA